MKKNLIFTLLPTLSSPKLEEALETAPQLQGADLSGPLLSGVGSTTASLTNFSVTSPSIFDASLIYFFEFEQNVNNLIALISSLDEAFPKLDKGIHQQVNLIQTLLKRTEFDLKEQQVRAQVQRTNQSKLDVRNLIHLDVEVVKLFEKVVRQVVKAQQLPQKKLNTKLKEQLIHFIEDPIEILVTRAPLPFRDIVGVIDPLLIAKVPASLPKDSAKLQQQLNKLFTTTLSVQNVNFQLDDLLFRNDKKPSENLKVSETPIVAKTPPVLPAEMLKLIKTRTNLTGKIRTSNFSLDVNVFPKPGKLVDFTAGVASTPIVAKTPPVLPAEVVKLLTAETKKISTFPKYPEGTVGSGDSGDISGLDIRAIFKTRRTDPFYDIRLHPKKGFSEDLKIIDPISVVKTIRGLAFPQLDWLPSFLGAGFLHRSSQRHYEDVFFKITNNPTNQNVGVSSAGAIFHVQLPSIDAHDLREAKGHPPAYRQRNPFRPLASVADIAIVAKTPPALPVDKLVGQETGTRNLNIRKVNPISFGDESVNVQLGNIRQGATGSNPDPFFAQFYYQQIVGYASNNNFLGRVPILGDIAFNYAPNRNNFGADEGSHATPIAAGGGSDRGFFREDSYLGGGPRLGVWTPRSTTDANGNISYSGFYNTSGGAGAVLSIVGGLHDPGKRRTNQYVRYYTDADRATVNPRTGAIGRGPSGQTYWEFMLSQPTSSAPYYIGQSLGLVAFDFVKDAITNTAAGTKDNFIQFANVLPDGHLAERARIFFIDRNNFIGTGQGPDVILDMTFNLAQEHFKTSSFPALFDTTTLPTQHVKLNDVVLPVFTLPEIPRDRVGIASSRAPNKVSKIFDNFENKNTISVAESFAHLRTFERNLDKVETKDNFVHITFTLPDQPVSKAGIDDSNIHARISEKRILATDGTEIELGLTESLARIHTARRTHLNNVQTADSGTAFIPNFYCFDDGKIDNGVGASPRFTPRFFDSYFEDAYVSEAGKTSPF